ncbi:MAG TPA: hypothetical protein VFE24_00460, partial [Pirellulales bacterium]|nr:hypothetical protein [Pirellulales bacterium]
YSRTTGVGLTARAEGTLPRTGHAAYVGPFRLEATRVVAERNLLNPAIRSLKVGFDVAWEPRLEPISVSQPVDKIIAIDDQGHPLLVDARGTRDILLGSKANSADFDAPFQLPSREVKKIASLKGVLEFIVVGGFEEFRFDDLAATKNKTIKKGDVAVQFVQARRTDDLWEVQIHVAIAASATGVESHTNWIGRNEAVLVGPDHQPHRCETSQSEQENANSIAMTYTFSAPKSLAGYTVVYTSPTASRAMQVAFEFKDIDLP